MAIYNTPDGRQVVGSVESGNDYHGFNGKRDIIIQLTADGATTDGLNALEYLKAYAVEQNKQNKPIFPNGTRVFISANGYTKAVEADDIVIDGDNITIGGIKWDGSAWDYSEAGQTGSGLPKITDADDGKVLTAESGAWVPKNPSTGGGSILPTEIENDLYTETLGEEVEFQQTLPIIGTKTFWGIEAVGMTSDIASEIQDDTTVTSDPAPMKYTYRIGDNVAQDSSIASQFTPQLADDGKYYFFTGNEDLSSTSIFHGQSGEVVAIYKTALQFPSNVLCLYDPTDPKGDESYLPEYVEYDEGFWVSSDYDASGFYNALTHGNAAYAVLPNSGSNNGYGYVLAGAFYLSTDNDDESYLAVSLYGAIDAYIYNWTGSSNES